MGTIRKTLLAVVMALVPLGAASCAHEHVDVDFVDVHGFNHHGYYDEHHDWHGGWYDADRHFHDDPHDWH